MNISQTVEEWENVIELSRKYAGDPPENFAIIHKELCGAS
jgi:hypothetical protein